MEQQESAATRRGVGRKPKYPWATMGVGDEFEVSGAKATTIHSAGIQWATRHQRPMKFSTKKSKDGVILIKRVS